MRILQIINDLRVAGAETLCVQLTEGLQIDGCETQILALGSAESPLVSRVRQAGALLEASSVKNRTILKLRSPSQIWKIRGHLAQCDLVHVHLFPAQLWTALASLTLPKDKRPVLVTTEHNTHNGRRKPIFRALDRLMYRAYTRIVCISEATSNALVNWLPELQERTVVIANGIDYDRFAASERADRASFLPSSVPADAPIVLCAGRLTAQKDQATALRAIALLPGVHLCLAGDGEMRSQLKSLAVELHIDGRVHFLGRRDDLPELLKAIDIYIQPSLWEGFGLAVAEAMAAGVPVVASDVPGMREVVESAGLLFPATDAELLAEQIRWLLDSKDLRDDLSNRGKQQAKKFTLAAFVEKHEGLYKQLVP